MSFRPESLCITPGCVEDREFASKYCAPCKGVRSAQWETRELVKTIANLNPEAGEIGAGMLANIVDKARKILKAQGIEQ